MPFQEAYIRYHGPVSFHWLGPRCVWIYYWYLGVNHASTWPWDTPRLFPGRPLRLYCSNCAVKIWIMLYSCRDQRLLLCGSITFRNSPSQFFSRTNDFKGSSVSSDFCTPWHPMSYQWSEVLITWTFDPESSCCKGHRHNCKIFITCFCLCWPCRASHPVRSEYDHALPSLRSTISNCVCMILRGLIVITFVGVCSSCASRLSMQMQYFMSSHFKWCYTKNAIRPSVKSASCWLDTKHIMIGRSLQDVRRGHGLDRVRKQKR